MKTLYLERSTASCRDGRWVEALDLDGVARIVVGTGPGSFAGIRAALAFAQGFALGRKCEVWGLPSTCAIAAQMGGKGPLAVIGDARRGKAWIALFDGFSIIRDIFQVDTALSVGSVPTIPVPTIPGAVPASRSENLLGSVPTDCPVITPDEPRIGALLKATFGARYRGGQTPTDAGLRAFAEANPAALQPEPRPIYLNPAVRD